MKRDACVQTMAMSEMVHYTSRVDGWCIVKESISSVITTREDVSTTASDGDVNPSWLKVCKKRSKKMMRTEAQETRDLNAAHNIDEEKITTTIDSGATRSVMPKDMLPNVPTSGGPENKICRVANGSKILDFGGEKITSKAKKGSVGELQTGGRNQSTGIGKQNLSEEERSRVRRRRQLHREQSIGTEGAHTCGERSLRDLTRASQT